MLRSVTVCIVLKAYSYVYEVIIVFNTLLIGENKNILPDLVLDFGSFSSIIKMPHSWTIIL